MNNINNLVGSDSANYHPLNITTCKEVEMSKFIYDALKTCSFKKSVKSFIEKNPKLFKFSKDVELSYSCQGKLNPMYGVDPWNKGKKVGYTWNKGITGYKTNYPKNRVSPKFDEERLKKHKQRIKLWWAERKKNKQ